MHIILFGMSADRWTSISMCLTSTQGSSQPQCEEGGLRSLNNETTSHPSLQLKALGLIQIKY